MKITESQFESNIIETLTSLQPRAWEFLNNKLNKKSTYLTENDLKENLKEIIERNNRTILIKSGSAELKEQEFREILNEIEESIYNKENSKGFVPFNAAVFLQSSGRATEVKITRKGDDENKKTPLVLFSPEEKKPNGYRDYEPTYQIAQQVQIGNYRADLMLLIDGLPVVLFENKREDVDINRAYNQVKTYLKEIDNKHLTIFSTIQVCVVAKENWLRYFARPNKNDKIDKNYCYQWTERSKDIKNLGEHQLQRIDLYSQKEIPASFETPVTDVTLVLERLFTPLNVRNMVTNHIIAEKGIKPRIMLMRKYQAKAVDECISRINKMLTHLDDDGHFTQVDNDINPTLQKTKTVVNRLGYVWHTTGAGKTVTSFKIANLIARSENKIQKVVFLVDRIDLRKQTHNNFSRFLTSSENSLIVIDNSIGSGSESDSENTSENTSESGSKSSSKGGSKSGSIKLGEALADDEKNNIIITTIQTLHKFLTSSNPKYKELIDNASEKNILFIVDEAHRSTSGDSLKEIRNILKYTAWIGFTGTPNLDDYKQENQGKHKNTEAIFGNLIHSYTILQAIYDRNVLGFDVHFTQIEDIKQVFDPEKNTDFANFAVKEKFSFKPYENESPDDYTKRYNEFTDKYLNSKLKEEQSQIAKNYIKSIVAFTLKNWKLFSKERKFSSMLTTSSINMAYHIFCEFRDQLAQMSEAEKKALFVDNLKFTAIFSNTVDYKGDGDDKAYLKEIREHYHNTLGFNENFHESDAMERIKRVNRKEKEDPKEYLDLIIVVDKLLTGFDAPKLHTLIVDRVLSGAKLIQAYSRTNRLYKRIKPFGKIINLRAPQRNKEEFLAAMKTYSGLSKGDKFDTKVIMPDRKNLRKIITKRKIDLVRIFKKHFNSESPINLSHISKYGLSRLEIPDITSIEEDADTYKHLKSVNRILQGIIKLTLQAKDSPLEYNAKGKLISGYDENDPDSFYKRLGLKDKDTYQKGYTKVHSIIKQQIANYRASQKSENPNSSFLEEELEVDQIGEALYQLNILEEENLRVTKQKVIEFIHQFIDVGLATTPTREAFIKTTLKTLETLKTMDYYTVTPHFRVALACIENGLNDLFNSNKNFDVEELENHFKEFFKNTQSIIEGNRSVDSIKSIVFDFQFDALIDKVKSDPTTYSFINFDEQTIEVIEKFKETIVYNLNNPNSDVKFFSNQIKHFTDEINTSRRSFAIYSESDPEKIFENDLERIINEAYRIPTS
ncbi:hypothetical protein CJP74_01195 [Psittacicella melopsittaci]|uniref:type I site-specific deoxyribonuclease n=1 Tax=Psittacicella melopsittaci TaxID=2028576 RepID=A0A3A1Y5V6_9GAMM|nr:DEAD/DEAH box helicase family protein [Psittacicella melopsittaci]RIY33632.1 hypothetical protein CJP74_01195 [Psittacicella melopsittaci]